jgi:hypothetical protein
VESDFDESDKPGLLVDAEEEFITSLCRQFPGLSRSQAKEEFLAELPDEEVCTYWSMLAEWLPDLDVAGEGKEWTMSKVIDELTLGQDPYASEDDRRQKLFRTGSPEAIAMEHIHETIFESKSEAAPEVLNEAFNLQVNTAYKRKAQKVQPINANDGSGEGPGGRPDWYARSKDRMPAQEPEGKYKDHLLPRIAKFPRGTRVTPERMAKLNVGKWLSMEEREMFDEMILNREGTLAFDWTEVGRIHEDVCPPIVIKTVPHEAWQEKNYHCPRALLPIVVKMLLERLERGVLEKCSGPYRNPWFLVAKKTAGTYRLICSATKMNSVTYRDANMPPSVDEFAEEFAGCQCSSLIDFFSGYDQLSLDPRSRDMTGFQTPIGLLRMTTVPQGATNSVAQFVRVISTILEDLFPKVAMPFLDDIGVKGPFTNYNGEFKLPGIRRFVYEHILNLDQTMDRIERAEASIGPKSQFVYDGMDIVGYICGAEGRSPQAAKICKILDWEKCDSPTEIKAFIGICVYYRIWIAYFGMIAEPLYRLLRKGAKFYWGREQEEAMETLKEKLTSAPILCRLHLDPDDGWGDVILAVDSSLMGWGATFGQIDDQGRIRVIRYESGVWSISEQVYDATKRECRGILKALQKLRWWLYGLHFILETDAKVLVAQLNIGATDLPGALVTRWLAWIRLFDFEVRHVKGTKHLAADGLSRRPPQPGDSDEEEDVDDIIEMDLDYLGITPLVHDMEVKRAVQVNYPGLMPEAKSREGTIIQLPTRDFSFCGPLRGSEYGLTARDLTIQVNATTASSSEDPAEEEEECPVDNSYSDHYKQVARYLVSLKKPVGMSRGDYAKLRKEAANYSIRDRHLWRNRDKVHISRKLIDTEEDKSRILKELHDDCGHTGRNTTFQRIAARYYWHKYYDDIRDYIKSCAPCQKKDVRRLEETLYPSQAVPLFHRITIDCTHLPLRNNKDCLVVARDDFTNWVEARAIRTPDSKKVARFIWEDIICRHGCFGQLSCDGGTEFMKDVVIELRKLAIRRVTISAYNSKGQGKIEVGHRPLLQALRALTRGGKEDWTTHLHAVLLADRTTVHTPTGHTPFYMVYGREAL